MNPFVVPATPENVKNRLQEIGLVDIFLAESQPPGVAVEALRAFEEDGALLFFHQGADALHIKVLPLKTKS